MIHLLGDCRAKSCRDVAWRWLRWAETAFAQRPPALIDVQGDYWATLGRNGRNMARRCARGGLRFERFAYNDMLDQMRAVDVSMPVRQGRPMSDAYRHPHRPIAEPEEHCCPRHETLYCGAFRDETLCAYAYLVVCGEAAILNRFIAHGQERAGGVTNGLVLWLVSVARERGARWLNYLTMESATEGLTAWKRRVGFRATQVRFAP